MIKKIVSIFTIFISCFLTVAYGQGTAKFTIQHEGRVLENGNVVEIRDFTTLDGEMKMRFEVSVTNISTGSLKMKMQRNVIQEQANTINEICWDQCMEPSEDTAEGANLNPSEPEKPYTDFYLNADPSIPATIGTTIIKYTFSTSSPRDKTLTVEVHYIYDGAATSTKEDSALTLSGGWSKSDFEALDLSDASLTGLDMTGIYIPKDVPALSPANPNLLIYAAEGVNVPATWKNVVKGASAESIELTDGYTFKSMKEFTTKAISYSRNFVASEWSTISIPFSPTSLPEKIKVEQFTEALNNGVRFENVDLISPNVPYIISAEENGEITFTGVEAIVPISSNGSVFFGDYTFQGYSESVTNDQAGFRFTLNPTGTEFQKETGNNSPAFRGYMHTMNIDENIIAVTHGRENSINQEESDVPVICINDGLLYISVKEAQPLSIYGINGVCVKKVNLAPGINKIPDLAKGVYLITGKKVIL